MAERLGEALLDLDTDDSKFNRGVDRAEKRAEGLGRVFDDTARRAGQLGKTLAFAAGAAGAGGLAAGIVGAVKRLEEMRKMSAQVDRALTNSGNTARTSAKEIEAWADALENRTGRAVEEVMEVSANLASYGFGRDEFYRAIELADDMAAAWGGDLRQNLEGLARALDDPINGMAMLSKRGIKLTDEQKDMAAAFLDAGDKVAAQGVVFEALEAQVAGVAEAGFGGLTKAIAMAQKVWETAFEELVTGEDNASDLRKSLEQLIATVSSPEFVDAAMAFASLMVGMIKGIADVAIAAHGAIRDLRDFLATGDGQVSEVGLRNELKELDKKVATARGEYFGSGAADPTRRDALGNQITNWTERMAVIQAELDRRATSATPSFPPVAGNGGGEDETGGDNTTTDATQKQRDAVKALIADLEHERDIVGLDAREQEILNTIRKAGVDATSEQGQQIRRLITDTENHRAAIEAQQQAYAFLGDIGMESLEKLMDGSATLGDVLGDVAKMIQRAVLQAALLGQGPLGSLFGAPAQGGNPGGVLGSLFSGMFAKGGLIPSGTFGIVGERGPEPVIGTSRGAMVLPNSALRGAGGGNTEVNVYNNAGVDVETQSSDDGNGGTRQDIILNKAVANAVARPGAANRAVRTAGRIIRR